MVDAEQGGDETPGPLMPITKGLARVAGSGWSYNRTMNYTETTKSHHILPSGRSHTTGSGESNLQFLEQQNISGLALPFVLTQ